MGDENFRLAQAHVMVTVEEITRGGETWVVGPEVQRGAGGRRRGRVMVSEARGSALRGVTELKMASRGGGARACEGGRSERGEARGGDSAGEVRRGWG